MAKAVADIAVAFLVGGATTGSYPTCERFLASYRRCAPGVGHSLYVIFRDADVLDKARDLFTSVRHELVFLGDESVDGGDIGACIEWARQIEERRLCILKTTSEILSDEWLRKLAVNLALPNVGLVGATGSYESRSESTNSRPVFPNPHIRLNAFMIDRQALCRIRSEQVTPTRLDSSDWESGRHSLTRQVLAMKREILVVGRNGRGYSPQWWPTSDTFQQGTQSNLLVADQQTRDFAALRWSEKRAVVLRTWGRYFGAEDLISKKDLLGANAWPPFRRGFRRADAVDASASR